MRIKEVEIRCCRYDGLNIPAESFRDGSAVDGLEFLVFTIKTESGLSASMFGFAEAEFFEVEHSGIRQPVEVSLD